VRRALLAFALLAAGVMLGGCGAERPAARDISIADAVKTSAAQGSSRIAFEFERATPDVLTGAFDYSKGTAVLDGEAGRVILTEDAAYIDLTDSPEEDRPTGGKRWLKTSVEPGAGELFEPFAADPAELLRFLGAAGAETEAARATVRGVDVTRYDVRLDVDKALQELEREDEGASVRSVIREFWPDAESAGVPLEVAVDDEGLLRQVRITMGEDTITLEFYDYGVDVDADPPPADEVVTMEDLDLVPSGEAER
jgi:hypothetical protein